MFKSARYATLLASAIFACSLWAQPAPPDADQSYDGQDNGQQAASGDQVDPPSRVARLSFLRGAVSFVPAGENDWTEAQINRPLITGDKLWADNGGRAELEIGAATIRLDQQSSFDFLNLDDNNAQIELTQGTLNLRVNRLYDNQVYEIDTPTLAFVISRVGEYRIDVLPNGQSTIATAFRGGGDVYGEGGARFRIEEGQSTTFNDPQLQNYETNPVPHADDFDSFCFERDTRWDHAKSRAYVSEDVIGYQDLDDNGDWSDVPEYGHVWYPTTVAVDWSPYHNGHWGWVGAYGWTWIDDASWGFAPFHYGRWANINNRWGWCPGERSVRPYYAPALVAFIGGGRVGVGFSEGGPVGWFPLGPRDVYFPGYHVSRGYFTNINVYNTRINNVTINNYYGNYSRGNVDYSRITYANRDVARAVTAVPAAAFIGSRPVAGAAIAVNRATFANSRVSGFAAVAPTHASLAMGGGRAIAPPAALANRNIVAASKPPAPVASFASRQALLQKNPGQALGVNQLRNSQVGRPAGGNNAQALGATGHANLKVVTNNGQPSRGTASMLSGRQAAGLANGNNGKPATASGNTPLSHTAPINGNGNPRAINNPNNSGAAQANGQLQSSRFAHPNGNATPNNGQAVQSLRGQTGNGQSVQSERIRSINGNNVKPANNVQNNSQADRFRSTNNANDNKPASNLQNNNRSLQTDRARSLNNGNSNETKPITSMPNQPLQRSVVPRNQSPAYNNSEAVQQQNRVQRVERPVQQEYHAPRSNAQEFHTQQPVQQQNAVKSFTPPPPPPPQVHQPVIQERRAPPANNPNEGRARDDKKKKDDPH